MTPTEKLIRDFVDEVRQKDLKVCQVFDIANVKRPLYATISDQWGNPMIEINFALHNYLHIMPTMDPKVREADWLFNRVVLLIQDLKEASNGR